jgi:SAM-dependent methyltransferase
VSSPPGERAAPVPGSFRDPDSRVFTAGERVLRSLSPDGARDWRHLSGTGFWRRAQEAGTIVSTEEVVWDGDLEPLLGTPSETVLEHERVPFVSYPYEWTFGQLKDAALLQLDLLADGLDDGVVLKDGSAYNVQFRGARPVFIDVGSFEMLREGEPWTGYRQFCMLNLFPLLLQAYRGLDFHPLLRGAVDGVPPAQARAVLGGRDLLRRGVLTHVVMQSRLERRYAGAEQRQVRRELRGAGFSRELIRANARRLAKLVRRLEWKPRGTAWTDYGTTNTYSDTDAEQKAGFVEEAAAAARPRLVWDLGCNDGTYSLIAARHAGSVVAVDADHATVEGLYRRLRTEPSGNVLPLVMDLADPSPGLGWRGRERLTLAERGTPDLTLCLALVHHVAITANIPLPAFLSWLRELETGLVIEFVKREDPMVQRLLAAKEEGAHADYELGRFERALEERFEVVRRQELGSGTRVIFHARPRG